MGQGFSVNARALQAGDSDVAGLQGRCQTVAGDAVTALAGMAGSAGHAGLASALTDAAGQGARTFFAMGAAYQHVSVGLAACAATYARTEETIEARARAVQGELS